MVCPRNKNRMEERKQKESDWMKRNQASHRQKFHTQYILSMRDPLSLWVSKHISFSVGSDPAFLQIFLASHSGITPRGPLLPGGLTPLSGKPELTKGHLCVCFSCALCSCSNSLPSLPPSCVSQSSGLASCQPWARYWVRGEGFSSSPFLVRGFPSDTGPFNQRNCSQCPERGFPMLEFILQIIFYWILER